MEEERVLPGHYVGHSIAVVGDGPKPAPTTHEVRISLNIHEVELSVRSLQYSQQSIGW